MTSEKWLPVVGYEGIYEVSDLGRVRSLDRDDAIGRPIAGRILSQALKPNGRMQITLTKDGSHRNFLVHRVVARAFHGTPAPDQQVCHNDGNPANNNALNLRWDTDSANKLDSVRHGTHYEANRTHCPKGHPLVTPNLSPAHARRGNRDCRACARGRTAASRAGVQFTQAIADEHYARLVAAEEMGEAA